MPMEVDIVRQSQGYTGSDSSRRQKSSEQSTAWMTDSRDESSQLEYAARVWTQRPWASFKDDVCVLQFAIVVVRV